jgi:hypothetical protein
MRGRLPAVGSIVLVTWDDASETPRAADDDSQPPCIMRTIGWLKRKTRRELEVAAELGPSEMVERWRGVTRIPRGMVLDVTRICSGKVAG